MNLLTVPSETGLAFGLLAAMAWLGMACGPSVEPSSQETGSSGTTTISAMPMTSSTGTTPAADDTSGGFITEHDLGDEWCDPFTQNCPPGLKCTMVSEDGGVFNAARCAPVVDDPGLVGEPCTVEGPPDSGLDTCDFGTICWDVDIETGEGTCRALCTGSESNLRCEDPRTYCPNSSNGSFLVCVPICDPLIQDCPAGQTCLPQNPAFICMPVAESPAAEGEPCEFLNDCEIGSFCAGSRNVAECAGASGCCTSFCDVGEPASVCVPPEQCRPFREQPLPLYEAAGGCLLPV